MTDECQCKNFKTTQDSRKNNFFENAAKNKCVHCYTGFLFKICPYTYDNSKLRKNLFPDSDFNDMADIKSVAADIIEVDSNNVCSCKATGYVLSDNKECFRCAKEDSIQGFENFSEMIFLDIYKALKINYFLRNKCLR